jgi:EAL domain-containing protein (putative c-di-GMP-specific phosphodiesterase class I)
LNGHEYYPSCSIGIALFHGKQSQLEDLLTQADTSMYEAKKAGRNTLRFFDPSMQKTLEKRVELEYALRKAVKSDQFQLYYQLQVDSENQPLGVEALIRWFHPEKGIISPSEFIPLAEEIHLIDDIGQWVLEVVCSQIIAWQTSDIFKSLTVSVNVSPMQFMQAHFVDNVKNTVEKYCVDPTRIKLELTETMVLANIEDSIVKMNQLKALGFAISLDDFGTGYSSLSYLKRLPFDQIKIDRSFIISATTNEKDAFLVQFVICMGEKFAMHVIAEGIETEEQFTFLENLNCNAFQGYLFGKPMPVADLEAQLRASVAR